MSPLIVVGCLLATALPLNVIGVVLLVIEIRKIRQKVSSYIDGIQFQNPTAFKQWPTNGPSPNSPFETSLKNYNK